MLYLAFGILAILSVALLAGQTDGDATPVRDATSRRRAKRAQRRREQREFRAWLQITAEPLW
jgi:hypothetical protein